jgi:hypothetical protein
MFRESCWSNTNLQFGLRPPSIFDLEWEFPPLNTLIKDRRPAREASQGMSVEEALEIYRSDPDVDYVEPNSLRYATATTPVDPFFTRLWGLNNTGQNVNGTTGTVEADIDATEAWDTTTGSNNSDFSPEASATTTSSDGGGGGGGGPCFIATAALAHL